MPNLVGIGNSQVPTNAMLGGLAYQDSVGEIDIDKIKAKTGDTAVDVFVYDTRKDSDGGAWRHRTQNTSWYNEGVSAKRGARKEFPAVAVIVAAYENLMIYDGDDPNLPMWMDFDYGSSGLASITMLYANGKGVSALNGVICSVGSAGWHDGLTAIDFIADNAKWRNSSYIANWTIGIGNRNVAGGYGSFVTAPSELIVAAQVDDVAMTVLPNAPINDSTGLPIPTIALATDYGTSIIKDDGTVIDLNDSLGSNRPVRNVIIRGNDIVHWNINNGTIQQFFDAFSLVEDSSAEVRYNYSTSGGHGSMENISAVLRNSGDGPFKLAAINSKSIAAAAQSGMSIFVDGVTRAYSAGNHSIFDSRVAYVTSDYNTGYMYGDIKGAFLSSTDTTDLTRNNVLTVGTFDSASGWSLSGAAAPTISGGKLVFDGTSGTGLAQRAETPAVITSGLQYTVKFTVSDYSSGTVRARVGNCSYGPEVNANGGYYHSFVSGSTPTETVLFYGNSFNGKIDDVQVYLEDQDRALHRNGLQVFGTIPKQVVATGAELVSYGPFSTLNRLRQYYNSDLNFGTNDFSIMFWVNHDGTDAHQTIVGRDEREFSIFILDNASYSRKIRVYAHDSSDSVQVFDSLANPFPMNSWNHVCVNYTGGNTATIYINGVLNNRGTLNYNINNTTYALHVGVRNAAANGGISFPAANCKLALLRISKGAPTADQVKKIYDDEKCLFHENAKCTLHGTSDDVKALAYDDTTNILHVGTSAGRSEFRGLNRINNTTTAVTTSISASNGLVAEQ